MRNNEPQNKEEKIELTLPVNSAYVSAARLTASSISNRMGFNIEDIEDIKSAVSEACIYIINQCSQAGKQNFRIEFMLHNNNLLEIRLTTALKSTILASCDEDELGIKMIQALMDSLEITFENGGVGIIMRKQK